MCAPGIAAAQAPGYAWAKKLGNLQPKAHQEWDGRVRSSSTDAAGNLLLMGTFGRDINFGSASLTETESDRSSLNTFITKYTPAGQALWAHKVAGAPGMQLVTDKAGNVYVLCLTVSQPTFTFDKVVVTIPTNGDVSFTLAKYDPNGNVLWAKRIAHDVDADCYWAGMNTDNAGNLYLSGRVAAGGLSLGSLRVESAAIPAGSSYTPSSAFLVKLDATGTPVWVRQGQGPMSYGGGVAVDAQGNAYLAGTFNQHVTFGMTTLTSSGGSDAFLAKYDAAGTVLWAQRIGGRLDDEISSVALDDTGQLFLAGTFASDTLAIGGTHLRLKAEFKDNYNNFTDAFLAKFSPAGTLAWAQRAGQRFDETVLQLATDAAGNAYLHGQTTDIPGYGTPQQGEEVNHPYVTKFSAAGKPLWWQQVKDRYMQSPSSMAVDAAGNAYISGQFRRSATFGATALTSSGPYDEIYLAKLRPTASAAAPAPTARKKPEVPAGRK